MYKKLGVTEGTNLILALFLKRSVQINVPGILYPIKIRAWTSDTSVFGQIFVDEEYNFPTYIKPKLIIDGGANVGYASIYFANKYKGAYIIAVEPEKSNIEVLKENTSHYPNIEVVESAIWDENTYLKIKDIGLGNWGFIVEKSTQEESGSFKAITIEKLLTGSSFKKIDILKLDIEGSEKELFSNNYEKWLSKVNILIIELHDKMKPGCSESFYSAIKHYDFKKVQRGENIILEKSVYE